jgi:hypothetical protein
MIATSHPQWALWEEKFPCSFQTYGCPIQWNLPNLDFLASALGELPLGIIYFPTEERFYFRDYVFGAHRPCQSAKIVALARKLVNDSVDGLPLSQMEPSRAIFESARDWVEHCKTTLAVEGNFFRGEGGHRRWIEGRYVEPVEKPSVTTFAETHIVHLKGGVLSSSEAYHLYYAHCLETGSNPLKKQVFIDRFTAETKKRWQVGFRHDLEFNGRMLQGWRELAAV